MVVIRKECCELITMVISHVPILFKALLVKLLITDYEDHLVNSEEKGKADDNTSTLGVSSTYTTSSATPLHPHERKKPDSSLLLNTMLAYMCKANWAAVDKNLFVDTTHNTLDPLDFTKPLFPQWQQLQNNKDDKRNNNNNNNTHQKLHEQVHEGLPVYMSARAERSCRDIANHCVTLPWSFPLTLFPQSPPLEVRLLVAMQNLYTVDRVQTLCGPSSSSSSSSSAQDQQKKAKKVPFWTQVPRSYFEKAAEQAHQFLRACIEFLSSLSSLPSSPPSSPSSTSSTLYTFSYLKSLERLDNDNAELDEAMRIERRNNRVLAMHNIIGYHSPVSWNIRRFISLMNKHKIACDINIIARLLVDVQQLHRLLRRCENDGNVSFSWLQLYINIVTGRLMMHPPTVRTLAGSEDFMEPCYIELLKCLCFVSSLLCFFLQQLLCQPLALNYNTYKYV